MLRTLFTAFCLLIVMSSYAQDNPYSEVSIASPTAAALGKFVDIPVNNHIGVPNISIPIQNISAGSLKLGVSLIYHASGLKVMENASWVGAGWALEAGGTITRTVNGLPDERGTNTTSQLKGHFSDYGFNSYMYNVNMQDWQGFANGVKDGEPDIFYFNFAGYTGKFYFSDDRTPVMLPMQDIKVEYNYTGTGSISSFILTTQDGTKYHFGKTTSTTDVDPVEITRPYTSNNGLGSANTISSWFLNKIVSADQQFVIDLAYQQENYSYYTISMFPVSSIRQPGENEFKLVKNYISGVRLSRISFANGYLDFIPGSIRQDLSEASPHSFTEYPNTESATLGAIQVHSNDGTCLKKYAFSYSYFTDNSSIIPPALLNVDIQSDKKRLRLDSLTEMSCSSVQVAPPYKFIYFPELVPRKLTFAQDHWGYYNGMGVNTKLIPTYTINTFEEKPGADRNSRWPEMRGGALQKIVYPTGGFTELEFEPHRVHVSGTKHVYSYVSGISIGYDGSNPITKESAPITLSAGAYSFGVGNTSLGSAASFNLVNVNNPNQSVVSLTAQPGQTVDSRNTIPAGTYKLKIYKDCSNPTGQLTGVGASASMGQMQPVAYAVDTLVGGLRAKTITQNTGGATSNIVTSYTYTEGAKSSGVLYSRPTYVQLIRNDLIRDIGYWHPTNGFVKSCSPAGCIACIGFPYYESPSSIRPMEVTKGYHIGYNEVGVSQTGNGYTIYRYYGPDPWEMVYDDVAFRNLINTECPYSSPNFPPAPPPFDYKHGELKYQAAFAESGKILNDKSYNISYDEQAVHPTPAFIVAGFNYTNSRILLGTNYTLSSSKKISVTTVENVYSSENADLITNTYTQYFGSPYHNAETEKTLIASNGDILKTKHKYAFDFRPVSCESGVNCAQGLTTNNSACQTQYFAALNACTDNLCVTNAFLTYQQCLSQARVTYINCRRTNYTDPINTYNTCFQSSLSAATAELKPVLELIKSARNAVIETSEWSNNNLLKANFNRYDYTQGIIYPEKIQQINLTIPSPTFTPAGVNGTGLVKDNRYIDEFSAKFNTGNIVEITDRKTGTTAYVWDYQNAFPIAYIKNAMSDQVAYTSFEADGSGNWFLSGSITADPAAITGKKCYNIGQTGGLIMKTALSAVKHYIVSYWTRNTVSYSIAGTIAGYPLKGSTINGWTYYEHKVTGQTEVSISGAGFIDELRLYPLNAEMFTFTYDKMVGITSECDEKNKISYYFYDNFGRLKTVKDMEGKILKQYDYQYQVPITE